MKCLIYSLWAAALFVLTGCVTRAPEWVVNPKKVYPEEKYLVAIGEGDTRQAAENAADANLSRIFEARIQSEERLKENTRETINTFDRSVDYITDVSILSSQTLYNIQHAEAWSDPVTARVHAIAYLERRSTAAILRDKISEKTARVEFLLAQAEKSDDPLRHYIALRFAARVANENEQILKLLRVIHAPSAARIALPYRPHQINQAFIDSARKIRVNIELSGDIDRRLTAALEQLITSYGFVVGEPAVLTISGTVTIADNGRRANLDYVRYTLDLSIVDPSDTIVISLSEKGREAHNTPSEARLRAIRTLENSIRDRGRQRFNDYFENLMN